MVCINCDQITATVNRLSMRKLDYRVVTILNKVVIGDIKKATECGPFVLINFIKA